MRNKYQVAIQGERIIISSDDNSRKKLLFVSHTFPYPPTEGIKLPVYYLLKEFSKKYSITLVTFIQPGGEEKYIPEVKRYCSKIIPIPYYPRKSIIRRVFNLFQPKLPFNVWQFFNQKMLAAIKQELIAQKYSLLFFDFLTTAIYKKFIDSPVKSILHYHDAMSMLFYRNFLVERNYLKKFYWRSQYKKIVRFEYELPGYFDKISVVAEVDKKWLQEKSGVPEDKLVVIPNGVDVNYFSPQAVAVAEDYPSLIFRGIMNFSPNRDACWYFLREILPIIRKEIPEVKFYIVGPNPEPEIQRFGQRDKKIIVTGYVEDIRGYIARATVNVCPMISGSGIKNKILEAMAMEKASVVTPIAAEGIPELKDGENGLIAAGPDEFAEKTVQLLRDKDLRRRLGAAGRQLVLKHYSWEKAAEKFSGC